MTTAPAARPPTRYRLRPPAGPPVVPTLDDDQRRVVDHAGGPLLVLAGPGTGKTTTLVEAVVDRVAVRGAAPDEVLALTFSRKAAEQLRDRVTARLGRTTAVSVGATFHSFAYGLVRRYAPAELYVAPLRLLSAPEQDVVLTELLTESPEAVAWPDSLRRALGTRGFAREVHDVLARARERGLEGADLRRLGVEHEMPEYVAAGAFLDQYLQVLDSQGALDYADLIRRAVIEAEAHRAELRARFRHVFVDEYQDTDPGQVALLSALASDGRDLVVVGDPHQAIYGFRGAEVRGILDFPRRFPWPDGAPAEVVALGTTRRFGPRLQRAAQRVAHRLPLPPGLDPAVHQAFAAPRTDAGSYAEGRVEVLTFDTVRAETEHLADLLRRAHLTDGLDWSEMAVLVRSGRATIPSLRRALTAAGVPVEVAADDTPLVAEPAVQPLLSALNVAVNLQVIDPTDPGYVHPDAVTDLLVSPLGGLDATAVRILARELRAREAATDGGRPTPSGDLLRAAVLHGRLLAEPSGEPLPGDTTPPRDGAPSGVAALPTDAAPSGGTARPRVNGPGVSAAAALGRLLRTARAQLLADASAEQVLWTLWSGTAWPRRLRERVEAGGAAARLAHRDLDAVLALFEAAARSEEQRGHTSVENFLTSLSAQRIPADSLAERGVRGASVRLLTAHRSKGLEWPLVVLAHVQEEGWPDLRRRNTLLRADRLAGDQFGSHGLQPPVSVRALLAEERRLFYVGCTRARQRLVVTAVASTEDDGEQPSRFLSELLPQGQQPEHRQGRPSRPLSLSGLVADLRRTASDQACSPALRQAAARRLARLATLEAGGRRLAPGADPATWWGTRSHTDAEVPVRPVDEPLELSASAVAGLIQCPARWFLEREGGGYTKTSQAQGFGNLAHALADRVGRGELAVGPDDVDALMAHVDDVWSRISFRTPWSGERERAELRGALGRFLEWHHRPAQRRLLATEAELRAAVALPDGQQVLLRGYADRLEVDADGRVVVIDLKTGKRVPTEAEVAENPQLGLYSYAVAHGAVDDLVGAPATAGGAELWQLRKPVKGRLKVQTQSPQQPGPDGNLPVETQLMQAARTLREETFEARPGKHCDNCAFDRMCPALSAGTVLS